MGVEIVDSLEKRSGLKPPPSGPDNWHLPSEVAQRKIVALVDTCVALFFCREVSGIGAARSVNDMRSRDIESRMAT